MTTLTIEDVSPSELQIPCEKPLSNEPNHCVFTASRAMLGKHLPLRFENSTSVSDPAVEYWIDPCIWNTPCADLRAHVLNFSLTLPRGPGPQQRDLVAPAVPLLLLLRPLPLPGPWGAGMQVVGVAARRDGEGNQSLKPFKIMTKVCFPRTKVELSRIAELLECPN